MRFSAFAFIATMFYRTVQVEDLIHTAQAFKSPFTMAALQRIKAGGQWGAKRADRTVDVIIFNPHGMTFFLRENSCTSGDYTDGLLPEVIIPRGRSSVYGVQSSQYIGGVQCTTRYESDDGNFWFSIKTDNPYDGTGSSVCTCNQSSHFSCIALSRSTESSQARFLIEFGRYRSLVSRWRKFFAS